MAVRVATDLLEYLQASSGASHVVLRAPGQGAAAAEALRVFRSRLLAVPHPEEPDDPAPNFVSDVEATDDAATLWFDMKDLGELMPEVVRLLTEVVASSGIDDALIDHPPGSPRQGPSFAGVDPETVAIAAHDRWNPISGVEAVSVRRLVAILEDDPEQQRSWRASVVVSVLGHCSIEPDDATQAQIREVAHRLAGQPVDPLFEASRRRAVAAWELRVGLPAALDAAGLGDHARVIASRAPGDDVRPSIGAITAICEAARASREIIEQHPKMDAAHSLSGFKNYRREADSLVSDAVGYPYALPDEFTRFLDDAALLEGFAAIGGPSGWAALWTAWVLVTHRVTRDVLFDARRTAGVPWPVWHVAHEPFESASRALAQPIAEALMKAPAVAGEDPWPGVWAVLDAAPEWAHLERTLMAESPALAQRFANEVERHLASIHPELAENVTLTTIGHLAECVHARCRLLVAANTVRASREELQADRELRKAEAQRCRAEIDRHWRSRVQGLIELCLAITT